MVVQSASTDHVDRDLVSKLSSDSSGLSSMATSEATSAPLDEKAYPASVLWTEAQWTKWRKSTNNAETDITLESDDADGINASPDAPSVFTFLRNEEGSIISRAEERIITRTARDCFMAMDRKLGPDAPWTWARGASKEICDALYGEMKAQHSILKLCDRSDWKVRKVRSPN